jgi:uncharacterized protein
MPLAPRLSSLSTRSVLGHEVPVAIGLGARALGLAGLEREVAGVGLLLPRCRSVHTFGMRFPLDLVFLGAGGSPLAIHRGVPRRRFVSHRGAAAVLEIPSLEGESFHCQGLIQGQDASPAPRDSQDRRLRGR